ncbi:hypothetical protein DNU06_07005 [Putridiphycobacter roseus]|uniref:Carboxypeptidase-like regulatory domain-containing protein n=1 Tax=Putridiphycobacter roseus TaxID=2219161 RepID=A0A2W1N3G3_9FLAO|nr:hypothetical protein [Putridiphycobacter roseus]PZE17571.1 hypothetical protein DNU06_07005 [Putridiphycobacter roseus]
MKKIPKPLPCNERWAKMTPTEGGRTCQSCAKLIVDFRKKSWSGIAEIQEKNNNTICGVYSKKQLKNWGQEPPVNFRTLRKTASIVAISTAVSCSILSKGQNNNKDLVIYGTVSGDYFKKQHAKIPIENAIIRIDSLNIESKTDSLGNFSFTVQRNQLNDSIVELTTISEFYGEQHVSVNTSSISNDSLRIEHYLKPVLIKDISEPTMFYAAPPTIIESLKEKIDTLNRKK